jgi:hypothetical protein
MKRLTKEQQTEKTAYHEAGHAVAAIALKRRFTYVTIRAGGGGSVCLRDNLDDLLNCNRRSRMRLRREIAICLAGSVADAIHNKNYDFKFHWRKGACSDFVRAYRLFEQRDNKAEDQFEKILLDTVIILRYPAWWAGLELLAAALIKKHTIRYAEARLIVLNEYWRCEQTTKALPKKSAEVMRQV